MPEPITTDAQPAASSAVPAFAVPETVKTGDFSQFRADSFQRGKPSTTTADPSPAPPVEQAASTDVNQSAASEPAKPSTANAETRIKELLAERHALRSENEQLRAERSRPPAQPETKPAASSPAPVSDPAAFPSFDKWLEQTGNQDKGYEDYIDARADHRFEQHEQKRQAKEAETVREREQQTRQTAYREKTETFIAEHPDFKDVVRPILSLPVNTPTAHALVDALQTSGPQLLYALAKSPDVFNRLVNLPERLALYELGKFEAALPSTGSPAPKVVTSAPEPPTTLGRKPVETGSDTQRAVRAGDFSSFRDARLRDEASKRSGQR